MSQVKQARILLTMRGDAQPSGHLVVVWSTKTERNRNVKSAVRAWALGIWRNQNLDVDVTVLDTKDGGKITVNGETEACCRFILQPYNSDPRPVSALSVVGAR